MVTDYHCGRERTASTCRICSSDLWVIIFLRDELGGREDGLIQCDCQWPSVGLFVRHFIICPSVTRNILNTPNLFNETSASDLFWHFYNSTDVPEGSAKALLSLPAGQITDYDLHILGNLKGKSRVFKNAGHVLINSHANTFFRNTFFHVLRNGKQLKRTDRFYRSPQFHINHLLGNEKLFLKLLASSYCRATFWFNYYNRPSVHLDMRVRAALCTGNYAQMHRIDPCN